MCSKSILTLFKWFKRSDSSLLKVINTQFELSTNRSCDYDNVNEATKATNEMILGDMLDLVLPKLAKRGTNWCFKWGKKNADKIQLNFN